MSSWPPGIYKFRLEHPLFEIVTTTAGAISIRNKKVNEIMHNPVGPWAEANALYIEQSDFAERLRSGSSDEFVVFDVGLGAASNAIAALERHRLLEAKARPLKLVSFECELELLRFTLEHAATFPHLQGYQSAMRSLLEAGSWKGERVSWELRVGDFRSLIREESEKPHLVFFDPYSPKVNQEMWTLSCFRDLRRVCRDRVEGGTSLFTYSQATRIRAALLQAGFFVGYGNSTGLKEATTQAATDFSQLKRPLDQAWFERWHRSHLRYPFDCLELEQVRFDSFIESIRTQYL